MGKEQLYLRNDQAFAVGQAVQLVHEVQPGFSGRQINPIDILLSKEEIDLKVATVPFVTEAEAVLSGHRKNIKAPGVRLHDGEKLPQDYEGYEPFRVNGELVMLSEATLDDVYAGNSGYTLRQLNEIKDVKYLQTMKKDAVLEAENIIQKSAKEEKPLVSKEEAAVIFAEDFLFQYNANRKNEQRAVEAAERIISEYQNTEK